MSLEEREEVGIEVNDPPTINEVKDSVDDDNGGDDGDDDGHYDAKFSPADEYVVIINDDGSEGEKTVDEGDVSDTTNDDIEENFFLV
eukprot:m.170022 g.170022  ORF g.170022 m.170022 type:complete len:87 (-) comp13485_c5_seq1:4655-4915(-)